MKFVASRQLDGFPIDLAAVGDDVVVLMTRDGTCALEAYDPRLAPVWNKQLDRGAVALLSAGGTPWVLDPAGAWACGGGGRCLARVGVPPRVGMLHWWWAEPDSGHDEPAAGGLVGVGWLLVHHLPSHEKTHHELVVDLPAGWKPDDPCVLWGLPKGATPVGEGVRLVPSGGVPIVIPGPLPEVIVLPTPHPSGQGFL